MLEFDITKIYDNFERITYKNLLKSAKDLQIDKVYLKDSDIVKTSKRTYKGIYTTETLPFIIQQSTLYINPNYYKKHQNKIQKILKTIIGNIKKDEFMIENKELITKSIINALSKNTNLKKVSLTEHAEDDKYVLSKEDYEILKNSSIEKIKTNAVSTDLAENFDPTISYNYDKPLISSYSYKNLINVEDAILLDKITANDLENLKYLKNPNLTLEIKEDNVEDALPISKRLKELGKPNHILIYTKNKEKIFAKIKENETYKQENIFVEIKGQPYQIKDFLRYETTLYDILKPTKTISPFEKYIYIYNVVKQFKTYKENEVDQESARDLYSILDNEYMVCVSYKALLMDLLNKVGINSIERSVSVDTSYDNTSPDEIEVSSRSDHARAYVNIVDPKYKIDGFYITDPTWNNFMNNDIYTHLALTNEEETYTRRYNFIDTNIDTFELFNINSLEEFHNKINFFINRKSLDNKNHFNTNTDYISKIIINLLEDLKKLSPEFTIQLESKYPEINNYYFDEKYEHEKEILDEIGNYIVSKVNKPISGKTIMLAVKEVYQKVYYMEGETLEEQVSEIAKENDAYQKFLFPKRYKIDKYGNKTELPNISDKFDLEENKRTR